MTDDAVDFPLVDEYIDNYGNILRETSIYRQLIFFEFG